MDSKLQEKLFKKYPKIFIQRKLPMTQTAMCWGIDTDDGWYWLLDHLCSQLQWDIDHNKYPQLEAVQVKEKFGGLRFYVSGSNEKQESMIDFAEFLSQSICEKCGSTKEVTRTKGGWIKSLCKKCMKEYLK